MSDMTNVQSALKIDAAFGKKKQCFFVDETYWGYIVRKAEGPATPTMILQGISMFLGACFAAAAAGLMLVPDSMAGSIDIMMRGGASVLFAGMAAYLLWYSSRGLKSEVQVDTSLGELREVIRNRAGRSTLVGRYGFDSFGGVFLDRTDAKNNRAVLMLRHGNTSQTLPLAMGTPEELELLRDRLGQDLMFDNSATRRSELAPPSPMKRQA